MESVYLFRSMIDFGLVVLIWLVQLIIYPGFRFSDKSSFIPWHSKYMWLVSFVVAPLMLFQLAIIIYQLSVFTHWYVILSLGLALLVWLVTFRFAVPIHNKLNEEGNKYTLVQNLVRINWIRTGAWTLIWLLGLLH